MSEKIKIKTRRFKFSFLNRIKKKKDFQQIQENGDKFFSKHFIIFSLKNNDNQNKIGITISKKVDKRAVVRNRLKRYIREIYRTNKEKILDNHKLVVIAKKNAGNLKYHDVKRELLGCLFYNNIIKKYEKNKIK